MWRRFSGKSGIPFWGFPVYDLRKLSATSNLKFVVVSLYGAFRKLGIPEVVSKSLQGISKLVQTFLTRALSLKAMIKFLIFAAFILYLSKSNELSLSLL